LIGLIAPGVARTVDELMARPRASLAPKKNYNFAISSSGGKTK